MTITAITATTVTTVTAQEIASLLRASPQAMECVDEFKAVSAARAISEGLSFEDLMALAEMVGDLFGNLPPAISAGVTLEEAAEASAEMARSLAGITYSGGGEVPPDVQARYAQAWAGK